MADSASPIRGDPVVTRDRMIHGDGWSARLDTEFHSLILSRYDDESEWTVDAEFVTANSYPIFCNGLGSRCTARLVVTEPAVVAALDTAMTKAAAA